MRPTLTASDLFSSRGRVDVLRVLWGVRVPLTAADVARRTRMTHPAVSTILRSLAENRIVSATPAGRGSAFWINRDNVYVEQMLDPVFLAERDMPDVLTDALRSAFEERAEAAVLFGSHARGDQGLDSDVDVVVVTEGPAAKQDLQDRLPSIGADFSRTFGAPLSVIVYDRDEARELANRAPSLYDSLLRDGVRLFGPGVDEWRNLESR
jgi:predicted nucleotidyltransferase